MRPAPDLNHPQQPAPHGWGAHQLTVPATGQFGPGQSLEQGQFGGIQLNRRPGLLIDRKAVLRQQAAAPVPLPQRWLQGIAVMQQVCNGSP